MADDPISTGEFFHILRRDLRRQERIIERLKHDRFDTALAEDFHERLRRLLAECERARRH